MPTEAWLVINLSQPGQRTLCQYHRIDIKSPYQDLPGHKTAPPAQYLGSVPDTIFAEV